MNENMNKDRYYKWINSACNSGIKYYKSQASFKDAWLNCKRGDWMLWVAQMINVDIHQLILAKGYCVKTIYNLIKDEGSKDAVVAAINFGKHLISRDELNAALYTASAAANDAGAAYAANAYAANAADAVDAAAAAAAVVSAANAAAAVAAADAAAAVAVYTADAYVADAVAAYAANAANAAAKIKNQLQTANICRKYLTTSVFKLLNIE